MLVSLYCDDADAASDSFPFCFVSRFGFGLFSFICFFFLCVCVLCSTVSLPIRFPFIHTHTYTLCLSLYFGHKKIKYTFFGGLPKKLFYLLCVCIRLSEVLWCGLSLRTLVPNITHKTAPFHLMLSLTWNKNIFHHPRFLHVPEH